MVEHGAHTTEGTADVCLGRADLSVVEHSAHTAESVAVTRPPCFQKEAKRPVDANVQAIVKTTGKTPR